MSKQSLFFRGIVSWVAGMGMGMWIGQGGGLVWGANDIVRIGEVPSGTIRLGEANPEAIRFGNKAPGTIALGERPPGVIPLGQKDSSVRKILEEMYYSVVYFSNNERAQKAAVPKPPYADTEQDFQLRNGTILKKARFQRRPDGWFRIQHQAGLGNYHIREFSEKDQMTLSVWRAQETSNWDWAPALRPALSAEAVSKKKLDFILIPEIELVDAQLVEVLKFVESYSAESDPGRKGMKFELDVWDRGQRITLPVLRYISLNQLLKLIAQKAGLVIEIGAESVVLRDPSRVTRPASESDQGAE